MIETNEKTVKLITAMDELGYRVVDISPEAYLTESGYHTPTGKLKILLSPIHTEERDD